MIRIRGMTTILFLGGWLPPFSIAPFTWVPAPIWFFAKMLFVMFCFLWVRATFPRFRYDQLMRLGWKVFLPFSLLWLVLTAGVLMAFGWLPNAAGPGPVPDLFSGGLTWNSLTARPAAFCSASLSPASG